MRKPRGTKRLLRRLGKEGTCIEQLNTSALFQTQYTYRKLGLGSWHTTSITIPLAVRQQALGMLLATLRQWHQALVAQPKKFYVAVWLFERDFAHSSQVVAAVGKRIKRYQNLFTACDSAFPLPAKYRELPGADQLEWQACYWSDWFEPEDFPAGWPAWMLRQPHHPYTDDTGREFLVVQTDRVWVGTLPVHAIPLS